MNEASQEQKQAEQIPITNVRNLAHTYTPPFDPESMTIEEYVEVLRNTIRDNIILFGKEIVRVRELLVAIRNANTLNGAKRLAREYMESAGN